MWWISGRTTYQPNLVNALMEFPGDIYGQIIDDETGTTLASASTISKDLREKLKDLDPTAAAKAIGEALASKAQAAGVTKVVFDRNGRRYGGRLQALADAARAKGLLF